MPDQPGTTQTQQTGTAGTDTGSAGAGQQTGQQPPAQTTQTSTPPWGDAANFDAEKAWKLIEGLREDKTKQQTAAQTLAQQVEDLKASSISRDALATALGVKPEEVSDTQRLGDQLSQLTERLNAAERLNTVRELADQHGVPQDALHLLTASDPAELAKQAEFLGTRLGGGQGGAGGGAGGQQQAPDFLPSNGQGQGEGRAPGIPEQIAAAEAARQAITPGTPERAAADQKVAQLKTQQLAALCPQ